MEKPTQVLRPAIIVRTLWEHHPPAGEALRKHFSKDSFKNWELFPSHNVWESFSILSYRNVILIVALQYQYISIKVSLSVFITFMSYLVLVIEAKVLLAFLM